MGCLGYSPIIFARAGDLWFLLQFLLISMVVSDNLTPNDFPRVPLFLRSLRTAIYFDWDSPGYFVSGGLWFVQFC